MEGVFARLIAACVLVTSLAGSADARTTRHRATAPAAPADGPTLLGNFREWSAYSRGDGDGKVCYALATPKSKEPARTKRDATYFLINDWPGRKAKAEPEIVPGYQYKNGSTVSVKVGSHEFTFFTKNQAGSGGAWVLNTPDEAKLIAALRGGATAVVTGTSRRGTRTIDTYALAGVSEAIDKIHADCGM